jgi:polyphosphate kinase 2 (PPK2 family)
MDILSLEKWYKHSLACDRMLDTTDSQHAPWLIVRLDNQKAARLNCISHLFSLIPCKKLKREKVKVPKRSK